MSLSLPVFILQENKEHREDNAEAAHENENKKSLLASEVGQGEVCMPSTHTRRQRQGDRGRIFLMY